MVLIAVFALPAAGASATVRFASPSGGTNEPCAPSDPCSLPYAITAAGTNDEVVVSAGTYHVSEPILAGEPLKIRGERAGQRPLVIGDSGVKSVLESGVKQELSDLSFESTEASLGTLALFGDNSVFDRIQVVAHGESTALRPGNSFTLRDSLLVAAGQNAGALFVQGTETGTSSIRNVTALASGPESVGISVSVTKPGATARIDALNTIASGETDASAAATSGGAAAIAFDHSNLDKFSDNVSSTNGQTALPLFVDAAAGDYREASGSPTIAAGLTDPANGATDLDGNPRTSTLFSCTTPQPVVTDIGAYQSQLVAVPAFACPVARVPNNFRFGRVIRNRRRGTAKLIVRAPTGGVFVLKSGKVRRVKRKAARKGNVVLNLRPKPRALKRLKHRHRMRVHVRVTFYPNGGKPRTKGKSLTLIRVKKHR
ncbi:MAG TPA: hypothetical protein VFJ99_01370 [Solirubrobacterales bacterium]|nr:hypothetical protein [Solirubrobacterales bacterium]